jgi:hypothetical protein
MKKLINDDGKLNSIDNIDLELIKSLKKVFTNDVQSVNSIEELLLKKGNLEVIDFLVTQYELMNGE